MPQYLPSHREPGSENHTHGSTITGSGLDALTFWCVSQQLHISSIALEADSYEFPASHVQLVCAVRVHQRGQLSKLKQEPKALATLIGWRRVLYSSLHQAIGEEGKRKRCYEMRIRSKPGSCCEDGARRGYTNSGLCLRFVYRGI